MASVAVSAGDLGAPVVDASDLGPAVATPAAKPGMTHVTTPFADPTRKPAFDTSKSDAAIVNQGVDAANTVGGTLGLFNRPLKASKALVNEGVSPGKIDLGAGLQGAGRALMGNPNPGEEAGNDAKNAAAISTIFKKLGIPDNALTHGLYETGQDPSNLLSVPINKGRTAMGVLTDAAEGHGFNAAVKAGNAVSKVAPKVTDAIAKAHDLLGVHSAAKRELANLHGAQWIDKYAEYRARLMQMGGKPDPALDAQAIKEAQTARATQAPVPPKKPHFTAAEVARMNKNRVPPPVHGPATTNTNAFAIPPSKPGRIRTWANAGVPPDKVAPAFSPEDQKIFGLMTDPSHGGGAGKNGIVDALSMPSDLITGGMFIQPVGHMANISGLGSMTDLSAVGKALGTGTKDNANKLLGAVTRGKLGGGETEASIAARHAPAQRGGAISTHTTERANPLDSGLSGASNLAARVPVVGKALAAVPAAVRGLYRASGDVLWKFDDEVKANRFQNLVDSGMDPSRAGLRVGGELVDYENKSPAARALRPIAPFSTWRTKAPLAVARNAVENPGRVAALNRAVPAAMGGSQGLDPQTGKPYISSLPAAEFNKATSSPKGAANYALGGLGVVPRLGLDAVGQLEAMQLPGGHSLRTGMAADAKKKQLRTQGTYGQEPGTFLLNELPGVSQALQYGPNGMFNKGQAPTTLSDLLSLLRVRPGNP